MKLYFNNMKLWFQCSGTTDTYNFLWKGIQKTSDFYLIA